MTVRDGGAGLTELGAGGSTIRETRRVYTRRAGAGGGG